MATKQPMVASAKVSEHPQVIVTCRTRVDEKSTEKVETKLTIIFDDVAATQAFAKRGATIAWQQLQRVAGKIPTEDEILVSELAKRASGGGFKRTPESLAAAVRKMPEAEYRKTLENLGLPKVEIDKLAKKQYAAK